MKKEKYLMGMNYFIKIVAGKWKPSIICSLGTHARRSSELLNFEQHKNHTKISRKVLAEQLRQLENDGIVQRTVYNTVPPTVVYSLTKQGLKLRQLMIQLSKFGEENRELVDPDHQKIEIRFSYQDIAPEQFKNKKSPSTNQSNYTS